MEDAVVDAGGGDGGSAAALAASAAKLAEVRDAARRRAEKFGIPYVEPSIATATATGLLAPSEAKRLARQRGVGEATGLDSTSEEARKKAAERAVRFNIKPFDYEHERLRAAGLSEEAIQLRAERRARAAKYGTVDDLDLEIARSAVQVLGAAADAPVPAAPIRHTVLHMRAGYLPAASGDIMAFFSPLRPSYVEWLNGQSTNVHFEDEHTAARALETFAEPVPRAAAAGVAEVDPAWRVCLKRLVKLKTDRYAVKGSETTVYLRYATEEDVPEKAPKTAGPKTHGTWSESGLFSLTRVMHDEGEDEGAAAASAGAAAAAPHAVASHVTSALMQAAHHSSTYLDRPLGEKVVEAPVHSHASGGGAGGGGGGGGKARGPRSAFHDDRTGPLRHHDRHAQGAGGAGGAGAPAADADGLQVRGRGKFKARRPAADSGGAGAGGAGAGGAGALTLSGQKRGREEEEGAADAMRADDGDDDEGGAGDRHRRRYTGAGAEDEASAAAAAVAATQPLDEAAASAAAPTAAAVAAVAAVATIDDDDL